MKMMTMTNRTSGTENDDYDNERTTSGTKCSTSGSTSKREKKKRRRKTRNVEVAV
jgi:hypothetical protein